ncbi:TerB family tellurite resistance protein [Tahibacter amnicola]|uniref:TerB family tellurite resistance protein n=1 Tax=Tahibacter amnicola TaxID=2976241 RepID=A0ABY6BGA8_9GAMM|nr:TerB family tellurite resistance protein [Tahibacter amnicola]UXI68641.1 TerB family tellurite resistance protein [Tahibacter amnicola]
MSPLPSASLELHHLQAIVRAMYDVARTDGVHDAELVMLRGFYESCQRDSGALASFDDIVGMPFDLAAIVDDFAAAERKAALIHSCLLLAHADGDYSAGERAKVAQFATALGMSTEELAQTEEAVADHLLQQISRISNVDALREVARKL